jgi:hypothetical protein
MIRKIVSGGQTGADRAALDFAIQHSIPHGGWCPKGRLAEDGTIDPKYQLKETSTDIYGQRTQQNVVDSDGTAIFTVAPVLDGGSMLTAEFVEIHHKPGIHLSRIKTSDPVAELKAFIARHNIAILNVAGSRASKEPDVYAFTKTTLEMVERHALFTQ